MVRKYQVQWAGGGTSWEPAANLAGCADLLAEFHLRGLPEVTASGQITFRGCAMNVLGYLNQVAVAGTEIRATVMLLDYDPVTKNHPKRVACRDCFYLDAANGGNDKSPCFTSTPHGPGRKTQENNNLPMHPADDVEGDCFLFLFFCVYVLFLLFVAFT